MKKFFRICPECKSKIRCPNKRAVTKATKKKQICRKCAGKRNAGSGNPFYGKTHTEETKRIISQIHSGKKLSPEHAAFSAKTLKKHRIKHGYYEQWVKKFGKDIADKKMLELKTRQRNNSLGKNNPMYGKPTPQGSGNGWKGWYKNWHFRSLRELQFYILMVEVEGRKCESTHLKKEYRINYILNGVPRTYSPDFIVDDKILFEIKPKKLWNCKEVVAKKDAAIKFCKKHGLTYKMVDIAPNSQIIKDKYLNGEIKFMDKYLNRFKKYAKI